MSTWLTEKEFLQSGAIATGITLNVAFLQEIKQENVELRQLINSAAEKIALDSRISPREVMELLCQVREELETYFALEEFYGYFKHAAVTNPTVSACAARLQSEHEQLYLSFNDIVELAEQIVYRETDAMMADLLDGLNQFRAQLDLHENCEMELMMRLCNEEIGVGD